MITTAQDKEPPIKGLDTRHLKERKVFLKNEKYECQGTVVVCTETTCNYSSLNFKAVYVGYTRKWSGNPSHFFGESFECPCVNYNKFEGEIIL